MKNNISISPIPGLADAVNRRFRCPYRAQADEVAEILQQAAAHNRGEVAIELADNDALPEHLRGKSIPALDVVRVEPLPNRVFHERAVRERRGMILPYEVVGVAENAFSLVDIGENW